MKINDQKGFTLIEMLVVIGIFLLITTIVLFSYSKFSTNITLRNLSQDMALSIRKAQVYTLGIKAKDSDTYGYGVHFDVNNPKSFTLFADKRFGEEGVYNEGTGCGNSPTECEEKIDIKTGDVLLEACFYPSEVCEPFKSSGGLGTLSGIDFIDISFRRPNPDAKFCTSNPCSNTPDHLATSSKVVLTLRSPKGQMKNIAIYPTGLISIEDHEK